MRKMNKIFAVAFAIIAVAAFYGAAFCAAPWHYATTVFCILISTVTATDGQTPDNKGLQ